MSFWTDPVGWLLDLLLAGMGWIALALAVAAVLYAAVAKIKIVQLAALGVALVSWSFGLFILGTSNGAAGADRRCEARIQKSIDDAAKRDRAAEEKIDRLNEEHAADRARLVQEIFKRDQDYQNERDAEDAAEAAKPKPLVCPSGRRATAADDRRVWRGK